PPVSSGPMARRKRKDDVPDWSAPEFDEVGYMRTEIGAARAAVATIAWAVVGAAGSFRLYSVHPALAFFAGIRVGFGRDCFLASVQVELTPNGQSAFVLNATPQTGPSRCANHTTETYPGGTYNVSFVFNASSYVVTIIARDRSGREATDSFQIFHS